jgi:hypothetical protein
MKKLRTILLGVLFFFCGCAKPLTVSDLKSIYFSERTNLNAVIQMLEKDTNVQRIANSWTRPVDLKAVGVSDERVKQYRALLKKARVKDGIEVTGPFKDIDFIYEVRGLAVSGSSRGLCYTHQIKVYNVITNLQAEMDNPTKELPQYEHIEGGWYVFFSFER